MALSRGQLLYLIEHNGAGDWNNISFISATTHYPKVLGPLRRNS